jgi:site-specific recombinase XerD
MKKIMYRAVFNRKKQLRSDGRGLVQIEAYLERRRMYISTHLYIWHTMGRSEAATVVKQLLTIDRHAGLRKHFSFHSARHTNAILSQGVSVTTVQKLLGHKNVRTTMNYCEVIDQTLVNELERIADEKAESGSTGELKNEN